MNGVGDLPRDLTYVRNSVVWHIAQIAQAPGIPNPVSLCGKRARGGSWGGECQGGWVVGKLCRMCRLAVKRIGEVTS